MYIVYITINKQTLKSYIGVHKQISKSFDGYIGCGISSKTDRHLIHPKTPFQFAVKKYGYESFHRIDLQYFESREAAYTLENQLVNIDWVSSDTNYNIALGGSGGEIRNIAVAKYTKDGNFVEKYKSISEAVKNTLHTGSSEISASCKSAYKTSGGFYWRVVDAVPVDTIVTDSSPNYKKRAVLQYSLNGEFITNFVSVSDAAKKVTCANRSEICKAANSGYLRVGGFYWRYKEGDDIPLNIEVENTASTKSRGIIQLTIEEVFVRKYNTIMEAKAAGFSQAGKCAAGKQPLCKGFIFKYED